MQVHTKGFSVFVSAFRFGRQHRCQQVGKRQRTQSACQLCKDHGDDHGFIHARHKAKMVAEHERGARSECDVEQLSLRIHILYHLEGRDVVGKRRHDARRGRFVHAEPAAELGQLAAEMALDPLHHGERAEQDKGDVPPGS